MNNLEVFNEIKVKLNNLVKKNKGFKINGVDDNEGYEKVKQAKNEIRKEEIQLEKLAKSERQQALEYQKGIIKLEKDLKEITSPIIEDYKLQIEQVDLARAREERKVLIPDRKKQLEEIQYSLSDEDILNYDEKQWFDFYNKIKLEYLEIKEQERKEQERKEQEEARIEQARKEAREQAIQEEREREEQEKEKNNEPSKELEQEATKELVDTTEKVKVEFISKEEIRKTIAFVKAEVKEENTEFAKGWKNSLARLFWELKI